MSADTHCPHCDSSSFALQHPLIDTKNFWVVCDVHPLCEGHILIIPKEHIECIGACSSEVFAEFLMLYEKVASFLLESYGSVSTFEHGRIGQTVFHAHVHLLPFSGNPEAIAPEGPEHLTPLDQLSDVQKVFMEDGQYLFFSIGEEHWFVDTELGAPRFFRDRFASALGNAERGNWKVMRGNAECMVEAQREMAALEERWRARGELRAC